MKAFQFLYKIKLKKFKFNFHKTNSFASLTKQVYLSQNEALLMNEHDRIMIQIENNAIPESNMKTVIQELTNYCASLSQYKDYMRGWTFIANHFSKNVEKYSNEEFIRNLMILNNACYVPENILILNKIYENLLIRQLPKNDFLNAINGASTINFKDSQFWRGVVTKLENYDLDIIESANIINSLSNSGISKDDEIFINLSENIKKANLPTCKEHELISIFFAVAYLPQNNKLKEKALEFINNNYNSFNFHALPVIVMAAENIGLDEAELSKLILEVAKNYKHLNQVTRFDFYRKLLLWSNKYTNLLDSLKSKNLLYSMPLPDPEAVKAFNELSNIPNDKKTLKRQLINEFYDKYAESMGFNPEYAKDFNCLNSDVLKEMRSNILVEEKL